MRATLRRTPVVAALVALLVWAVGPPATLAASPQEGHHAAAKPETPPKTEAAPKKTADDKAAAAKSHGEKAAPEKTLREAATHEGASPEKAGAAKAEGDGSGVKDVITRIQKLVAGDRERAAKPATSSIPTDGFSRARPAPEAPRRVSLAAPMKWGTVLGTPGVILTWSPEIDPRRADRQEAGSARLVWESLK
jgi:hypothetical protein